MSDETKCVDWETLDKRVEDARAAQWNAGNHPNYVEREMYVELHRAYPAIRAEMRAKDLKIYRLESEVTLLRINAEVGRNLSVHMTALRAALTETYNAAMWLASDETGREVPKWVYDAIEAARKLGATK